MLELLEKANNEQMWFTEKKKMSCHTVSAAKTQSRGGGEK